MSKKLIFVIVFLLVATMVHAGRNALTPVNLIPLTSTGTSNVNVTGFNQTDYTLNVTDGIVGVNTTVIQKRVTGTCSSSQAIRIINEDGTVTCVSVGGGAGGGGIATPYTEYFNGSNNIITLNNNDTSQFESIYYNGQKLRIDIDYFITHKSTNSNVTINIPMFDIDYLIIDYFTTTLTNISYNTDDYTGLQLLPSKNVTLSNTALSSSEKVYLNGQRLRVTIDYDIGHLSSSSWLQIYNPIINSDYVVVDYYTE